MKVKQYRAANLQEAFAQAQAELGDDAVLLHQKDVVQPAQAGRRAATLIEITVGVDESGSQETANRAEPFRQASIHQTPLHQTPLHQTPVHQTPVRQTHTPAQNELRPTPVFADYGATPGREKNDFDSLRREIAQIRALLQRRGRGETERPEALFSWADALQESALPAQWVDKLLDGLDEMLTPTALRRDDMVGAALSRRMVAEMTPAIGPIQPGKPGKPLVFALVGPTGVGKTTTIAKLAAHYSLQKRLPIAIITVDTYRIGAVNQLRTYSELMQSPLAVAYTPDELRQSIANHQDKALILIDTPGRSPADNEQLSVLRSFIDVLENPHLQIALAAGTPLQDGRRILDRFSVLPPAGIILTKVDETSQLGSACGLLAERQLPLSYFTTGQRVPEDIEIATNEALLERLLLLTRGWLPETNPQAAATLFPVTSQFQRFSDFTQLQ
ncbi:MAG: flagellar biosynthesis protein FlhF [Caldilineaceae bacterium]